MVYGDYACSLIIKRDYNLLSIIFINLVSKSLSAYLLTYLLGH